MGFTRAKDLGRSIAATTRGFGSTSSTKKTCGATATGVTVDRGIFLYGNGPDDLDGGIFVYYNGSDNVSDYVYD